MIQMLPPPLLNYTLPSASHQASEGQGLHLQGDVHACTPSSIWSGPKDVSLVTAMCDRDYIAGEAQMHRKLRCDTG